MTDREQRLLAFLNVCQPRIHPAPICSTSWDRFISEVWRKIWIILFQPRQQFLITEQNILHRRLVTAGTAFKVDYHGEWVIKIAKTCFDYAQAKIDIAKSQSKTLIIPPHEMEEITADRLAGSGERIIVAVPIY